jgi:polyisoprenoid-binding protein YceI
MKNLLSVLLLAISLPLFANGTTKTADDAPAWRVDKAHSSINFSVRHFFTPTTGKFQDFEATVHFAPDNLEGSKVELSIPIATVDTDNEKRDGHLQSDDFFSAETYPNMTFVSSEFIDKGDGLYHVKGTLTIKDVSKEVELPVKFLGVMDNPMQEGKKVAGFQLNTTILRNDYGVGTGNYVSDAVIGNEVNIDINLEVHSM